MEEISIIKSENKLKNDNKNIIFYIQNPYNFYYNIEVKKENVKSVKSSLISYHSPIGINEMQLLAFLRTSSHIHLSHTDIVDVILNKKVPYYNKKKYQLSLKKLYSIVDYKKHKKCEKKILPTLKECIDFVSAIKGYYIILPVTDDIFIIYHEKESDKKDEGKENNIPIHKIPQLLYDEKAENIIHKKLPLFKENGVPQNIDFIHTLDNHIIDNINNEKKLKLNSFCHKKEKKFHLFNIDFIHKDNNIYLVEYDNDINYRDEILLLSGIKFSISLKSEGIFNITNKYDDIQKKKFLFCIKKLWSYGYLLDDFGYNYYLEEMKILKEHIRIPGWLKENNIDDLIVYIDGQLS